MTWWMCGGGWSVLASGGFEVGSGHTLTVAPAKAGAAVGLRSAVEQHGQRPPPSRGRRHVSPETFHTPSHKSRLPKRPAPLWAPPREPRLPQDRAGARKGLKWERGEKACPQALRFRGCPCNCKRRARCTGPTYRASHWGNLGRRASSPDPRARRPAGVGRSMPRSRERPGHGDFRRATTKAGWSRLRCEG